MSLTPFIRHELEHQPGTAAAPENSCTRCSPPLGKEPDILLPGDPAAPGTQVPPHIETPGQTPHPDTNSAGIFGRGCADQRDGPLCTRTVQHRPAHPFLPSGPGRGCFSGAEPCGLA